MSSSVQSEGDVVSQGRSPKGEVSPVGHFLPIPPLSLECTLVEVSVLYAGTFSLKTDMNTGDTKDEFCFSISFLLHPKSTLLFN